jgi:transcriptional regulator with XRE-family HTH domain
MATARHTKPRFDTQRLVDDMALRGWEQKNLTAASGLSAMTISRFIRAERQTVKTAARIAHAMGYTVRRYLIRQSEAA